MQQVSIESARDFGLAPASLLAPAPRSILGRVVPTTFTLAGVAIPVVTAASILLHAANSSTNSQAALSPASAGKSVAVAVTPTPTSGVTATPAPTKVTARTVAGPVIDDPYGQVQATITVSGSKITNVSITAPEGDPRSAAINQQAVPLLQSETLQAQSANVNAISGATFTSEAYLQSLQGALQTVSRSG